MILELVYGQCSSGSHDSCMTAGLVGTPRTESDGLCLPKDGQSPSLTCSPRRLPPEPATPHPGAAASTCTWAPCGLPPLHCTWAKLRRSGNLFKTLASAAYTGLLGLGGEAIERRPPAVLRTVQARAFGQNGPSAQLMAQRLHAKASRNQEPPIMSSIARVYADVNVTNPPTYWDYENLAIDWG